MARFVVFTCGGGEPDAVHLNEINWPGRTICSLNVEMISGVISTVQVPNHIIQEKKHHQAAAEDGKKQKMLKGGAHRVFVYIENLFMRNLNRRWVCI